MRRGFLRGSSLPHREGAGVGVEGPCRAREVLERIGDKWTLYVVHVLGDGTRRFSELQREIDGARRRYDSEVRSEGAAGVTGLSTRPRSKH
jgi:hypothetical protein